MLNISLRRAASRASFGWAACACLMWLPVAQAADAPPPDQAAPGAFGRYQAWRDEPLLDWREANKRVGEAGGWRTYLRESQQGGGDADSRGQPHSHREETP